MKLPISLASPWSYVASAAGLLALVAAIVFGTVQCKRIDQANHNVVYNSGVTAEKQEVQQEVLNHVQEVHNTVSNPTPSELNVVCQKYDRNCPHNQ